MQSFVQIVALHFKLSKGKHIMMITPKKEIQNVRIVFILDKSGSMNYIKNKTVSGFNEYIEQQKAEEGDAFVTLVQFDGKVSNSYTDVRIQDVPELQFYPNGNTALYDAVGSTVASMLSQPDRFDKTIIVIMTDGEENSSREYQHSTVMSLLNEAQKRLKILEKQQHQHLQNTVQNDLFSSLEHEIETQVVEKIVEVEAQSPALELLDKIDVDDLTPRQALEQLYQLKALFKSSQALEN
jgi:uncharacterized protein with von Willebrand factor type A (vWA) domain